MKNLIKAELFKLKKSTAYKVLIITYLLTEAAIQMNSISNSVVYPKYNPAYTGCEWLQQYDLTLLYMAAVLFFVAFFVNGDFVKHTFYSSLMCGVSRREAFLAKLIAVFAGTVPLLLISVLTGTVLWSIHAGFGMRFGAESIWFVAKVFAAHSLASLALISNGMIFAVIAKSRLSAFIWSFGSLYIPGVLRGNIENIIPVPVLRDILLTLLSLFYLNLEIAVAAIVLKFAVAGYIFERCDLK